MTTAPDLDHQNPLTVLIGTIWPHIHAHRMGRLFTAPVGLILDDENGLQPDLVYVSRARTGILTRPDPAGYPWRA